MIVRAIPIRLTSRISAMRCYFSFLWANTTGPQQPFRIVSHDLLTLYNELSEAGYLDVGHGSVTHLHLGIDIVPLLRCVQRAIVPHDQLQSRVEWADIVRSSQPSVLLMGCQTVATVRIAGCHNKHVLRYGLKGKKVTVMDDLWSE